MMKVFGYLIVISAIFFNHCVYGQKTVVTISGTTKTLDSATSCAPEKWNNSKKSSCACCIVKQKQSNTQDDAAIIKACKQNGECSDEILQELSTEENTTSFSQLFEALYDKAVVIRHVDFDPSLLTNNGKFTERSLAEFLAKAYKENKLSDEHFSNASCLQIKDLMSKAGATGINLLQLFLVTSDCGGTKANYIIKQMGKGTTESKNIEKIKNASGMKELIAPNKIDDYPMLAIPIAYLSYSFKKNPNYMAIMPAAAGVPLGNLILQYNDNPSAESEAIIKQAYFAIGKQLANFYKKFRQPNKKGKLITDTVIHYDLHSFNLFYDEKTQQVTFIDTETMAQSIKERQPIYFDLIKLLYVPMAGAVKTEKGISLTGMLHKTDKQKWIAISFEPFIRGYLSVYPDNQKKQVLDELHKIFKTVPSKVLAAAIAGIFINPIEVQSLVDKYVDPLFKQLKREFK